MEHQEIMTTYLAAFIRQLSAMGIRYAVVSPGSRSTPIAMLLAEHPDFKIYMDIDERSAAFFALGLAKEKRKPVVLLCTSGTAAANYYPAVAEANISRVPLIVLTADRPHELRNVGAPQAIDQIRLYGTHVKWFEEMPLPEAGEEVLQFVRQTAARAVVTALQQPAGPVHLNFPLREPLVPVLKPSPFAGEVPVPAIENFSGTLQLSEETVEVVAKEIREKNRGLIICGPIDIPGFAEAVVALSEKTGYPVLADPLSQLRSGRHGKERIIENYDSLLKDPKWADRLAPDVVIRFGAMPVSKPLTLLLKKVKTAAHYIVDGGNGWRDPVKRGTTVVYSDEIDFCKKLSNIIVMNPVSEWFTMWEKLNQQALQIVTASLEAEETFDEGKTVTELAAALPDGSTLFVGNSMPIRDVDTFFQATDKKIRILANRGANGIDGVVSSAAGVSAGCGKAFLLIGDLSFFHDLNGLLMTKMHKLNLCVILINNNGGGIFSFLPQADEPEKFEQLFGTPTDLAFEYAVKMYGGSYIQPQNWDQFRAALSEYKGGLQVIEVRTNRAKNVETHRKIWSQVSREMERYFQGEQQ
ncbi:MAG: 2-succinyl-5-enolpyruvyl-6-hydroxy-3-cyclohexene-1-carboxylic-acid synthase [Bacillus sp. (in: Bacteria)]|nr:2-succinyl-5-enolpyruvyl-6-hydroxy-3-cyclohexene-1-carboxylic-acid synthase [Bacillus sp. (in: firmicutes)]